MSSGADPVSWLVVEKGWRVVSSDGQEIGTVEEVVGDSGKDIFNGLAISPGLLRTNAYVPAEQVAAITEGTVELGLTADEAKRLPSHESPPPSAQIRPG